MTESLDYQRFLALMRNAAEKTVAPAEKDIGRAALAMFHDLEGYTFEAVQNAVDAHCRSERFFPTLADIISRLEGNAADRAAVAWSAVLWAVERIGSWESVCFPCPAIHYAISRMGGWVHLCEVLSHEREPFLSKDFARFFSIGENIAAWEDGDGKTRVARHLPGRHEVGNRGSGYKRLKIIDTTTGDVIKDGFFPEIPGSGDTEIQAALPAGEMGEERYLAPAHHRGA